MGLSYEELMDKQQWLADELTKSIKAEFNKQNIVIANGIGRNRDGALDFSLSISDLDNPDQSPDVELIDFAKAKMKELVPDSDANVVGVPTPKQF
ncbi:MAG: hypothetical protein CMH27_05940 [Micavibrio sp.]|nr:hypothetical protein [Micavibrio sp.]|tara:strand:+ start:1550 stop:1834 length:285 start_codon:yes stop_codon:yes gene_type:complete